MRIKGDEATVHTHCAQRLEQRTCLEQNPCQQRERKVRGKERIIGKVVEWVSQIGEATIRIKFICFQPFLYEWGKNSLHLKCRMREV